MKSFYRAINRRARNLNMTLKSYFRLQLNCKQPRAEVRNGSRVSNYEAYFPSFSEISHTIF